MPKSRNRNRPKHHAFAQARRQASVTDGSGSAQVGAIRVNPKDGSLAINTDELETPQNIYDADVAWLEYGLGRVMLYFATLDRDDPETLRSRLELKYPPEDFVRIFYGNSREFHDNVRTFLSKWENFNQRDELRPEKLKARQQHSQSVNFEYMSFKGSEASIDFYHLPTAGVAKFAKSKTLSGLEVVPMVRVQLTTLELCRLLDSTEAVVASIKERIPRLDETGLGTSLQSPIEREQVKP